MFRRDRLFSMANGAVEVLIIERLKTVIITLATPSAEEGWKDFVAQVKAKGYFVQVIS